MALRQLIDGQTIEIDNHNRGTTFKCGKGIHLHKRMDSDKYSGAEVLIPIYDDDELYFRNITGNEDKEAKRIIKEIRDAFKDPYTKTQFIKSFYKSLNEILKKDGYSIDERIELAKKAAIRLAKHFALKPQIIDYFGDVGDKFYLEIRDSNNSKMYILENPNNHSFIIGKELQYINKLDKKLNERK